MKSFFVLGALAVLSACGVDGEPIRPAMTASMGVGDSGIHTDATVSAAAGNWTMSTGLGL